MINVTMTMISYHDFIFTYLLHVVWCVSVSSMTRSQTLWQTDISANIVLSFFFFHRLHIDPYILQTSALALLAALLASLPPRDNTGTTRFAITFLLTCNKIN